MIPQRGRHQIAVVSFNVVPRRNATFKYERLGPMAIENHRQYCARHGYAYYEDTPDIGDRPACWAKIPALLRALEVHPWVLWADSDALVFDPSVRLESFCDPSHELVVQCPRAYFRRIGRDVEAGLKEMPINTGVFMLQASPWTRQLLQQAYERTRFVSNAAVWDGIGDQEALTDVLRSQSAELHRIGYVKTLHSHPSLRRPGQLFVHFYGNHASHRIALAPCKAVLQRWQRAVASGGALPRDLARFHWCCIQNKRQDASVDRGGPERFLYRPEDLEGSE